jgi:hypothetical protein
MNSNEYDDEAYTRWSNALAEAIGGLWEAGASEEDIKEEVRNALESVQ